MVLYVTSGHEGGVRGAQLCNPSKAGAASFVVPAQSWASPLVAYDVVTGARRKSSVRVEDLGRVFLR
jgi:hypothetical protein